MVETKLWRNSESRRTAVAQVLDYAVHVRKWQFDYISSLWKKRHQTANCWKDTAPDEDEQDWIDRFNRNLNAGRLALLVVGDNIRPEIRELASAVAGHPAFPFRLVLIELRIFRLDEGYLIVPDTLVQTQEIEPAVVTVEYASPTQNGNAPAAPSPPAVKIEFRAEPQAEKARLTLSAEAFRRTWRLSVRMDESPQRPWIRY